MEYTAIAGDGATLFYGAIIFLALSWIFFLMRVGVRVWRKAWGLDDYFMLVGIVWLSQEPTTIDYKQVI